MVDEENRTDIINTLPCQDDDLDDEAPILPPPIVSQSPTSAIQFFQVLLLLQYMTHFNFSNIHIIMIISIILQHLAIHNGSHILQLILPTILTIVIHIVSNSLIHSILDCSIVELRFVLVARVLI